MPWEFYTYLNVAPTAPLDEIKRAVARKRRELEIAGDAAGKAHLNEIAQTLRDPQTRSGYDLLQQHGTKLVKLVEHIAALREAGQVAQLIPVIKEALIVLPDNPLLRNQLGCAYADNGNFREALKIFGQLVKQFPDTPMYQVSFGNICLALARRVIAQEQQAAGSVDVLLTGYQAKSRVEVLRVLGTVLRIDFEAAKEVLKSAPCPIMRHIEQSVGEDIARTLRKAGAMVKTPPSTALGAACPTCQRVTFFAPESTARKLACDFCDTGFSIYRGNRDVLLRQARQHYQRAIDLEPLVDAHYLEIAESYRVGNDYKTALQWVERALAAGGQVTADDLDALLQKCVLQADLGQSEQALATARQIAAILPADDQDECEYAGEELAIEAGQHGLRQQYAAAKILAEAALLLVPGHAIAQEYAVRSAMLDIAYREFALLQQDGQLLDALKTLIHVELSAQAGGTMDSRTESYLIDQLESSGNFDYIPRATIRASFKRLKTKYPTLEAMTDDLFAQLRADVGLTEE